MSEKSSVKFGRRDVLKTSAMALGGALLVGDSRDAYPKGSQHELQPFDAEDNRSARRDGGEAGAQSLPHHSDRYQSGSIRTG